MSKKKTLYTAICFGCGAEMGKYTTEQWLNDALRQKGWMIFEDEDGTFPACPTCIKEELKEVEPNK